MLLIDGYDWLWLLTLIDHFDCWLWLFRWYFWLLALIDDGFDWYGFDWWWLWLMLLMFDDGFDWCFCPLMMALIVGFDWWLCLLVLVVLIDAFDCWLWLMAALGDECDCLNGWRFVGWFMVLIDDFDWWFWLIRLWFVGWSSVFLINDFNWLIDFVWLTCLIGGLDSHDGR